MKLGQGVSGKPTPYAPKRGREKRRLVLLVVSFFMVAGIWITVVMQARKYQQAERTAFPVLETPELEETIALPEIDVARIEALVSDEQPEERVVLEHEALDLVLDLTQRLVERQYTALGIADLDAATSARLRLEPAAARGRPFRARGWLEHVRTRAAFDGRPEEHQGELLLEDGATTVYFVTRHLRADGGAIGDFVRLDGLFLKAYSEEGAEGWVDGPLLVGSRLERSTPRIGTVDAKTVEHELVSVLDDGLDAGLSGLDPRPYWWLMAWARDLPADAVDWEAAPELDQELRLQIVDDGARWRGAPVRIPISQLQAGWVTSAGENPLREERITQGWIGNSTWSDVIQFHAPRAYPELKQRDLVRARGFFLKNLSYEPRDGGLRQAPLFVLHSIEVHVPVKMNAVRYFMYGLGAVVVGGVFLLWFLLSRDRRRTEELRETLVRRRRARREKKGGLQPG